MMIAADDILILRAEQRAASENISIALSELLLSEAHVGADMLAAPPPPSGAQEAADDDDREKMVVANDWVVRRLKQIRALMCFEVGLLVVALIAMRLASTPLPFVVWAAAEVGLVWHRAREYDSRRRLLYWLKVDMASGVVHESVGYVRSYRIFGRMIEDASSGRRYVVPRAIFRPSTLKPGTEVVFRHTIQSRLVLSLREKTD